jgi:hypothetical protein
MALEKNSEENQNPLKPDKNHAQILIEIGSDIDIIEKIKKIIEGLGVHVIEIRNVPPQLALFKLDAKDMREVALILSEKGFLKIEGCNALEI